MIKLEIPGYGDITLELDYDNAPISSKNFEDLVKKGFYDGLTFHRVIKGFMIQGGCPHGTGTGGPGYTIKGEFKANGVDNPIKHTRGTLSMARASDPNSAGSQFFIMHKDAPYLDGSYAAFGHVVDGIEVVDKIASTIRKSYHCSCLYNLNEFSNVKVKSHLLTFFVQIKKFFFQILHKILLHFLFHMLMRNEDRKKHHCMVLRLYHNHLKALMPFQMKKIH